MTQARLQSGSRHVADMAVLIPVWQPDRRLTGLVCDLLELGFGALIIVNDGSGPEYDCVFDEIRSLARVRRAHIRICSHDGNMGKGRALKTGLTYFQANFPNYVGVVTADADGQHRPGDIYRIAEGLQREPSSLVLGSRTFGVDVPARSRMGNVVTRHVFALLTGSYLGDTQSGLRAIPAPLIPSLLAVEGERYEYEMNVLAHTASSSRIAEVPIQTVYLDGNHSSHFRPFVDSMRIYFVLLRFFGSSLIAAAIDFLVFTAVFAATGNILMSMVAGRVSSVVNFAMNRRYVFRSGTRVTRALVNYYLLVAGIGAAAYLSIRFLSGTLGIPILLAKVIAETALWLASFLIQRSVIFRPKARSAGC